MNDDIFYCIPKMAYDTEMNYYQWWIISTRGSCGFPDHTASFESLEEAMNYCEARTSAPGRVYIEK